MVGGDDQIPANDIMMSSQGSMEHSSVHYNLFVHTCIWRLTGALSHRREEVSVTISLYIHVSGGYNVTGALSHRREEVSVTISRR